MGPRYQRGSERRENLLMEISLQMIENLFHGRGTKLSHLVMETSRDKIHACAQSFLSQQYRYSPGIIAFDERDIIGYIKSFWNWFGQIHKVRFPPLPITAIQIPDQITISLFSDWGTGLYGAPAIAKLAAEADIAIHLGDVYYAGTQDEYANRVQPFWPKTPMSFALNGNHDMYSGGHGYAIWLAKIRQNSFCFALENKNWLILGLDTAYEDANVNLLQQQWIDNMISQYPDRSVIFLSHHQPWSSFADDEEATRNLSSLFTNRAIDSWYWGHEHRCVIYHQHPRYHTYGRCLGIGGFPYRRDRLNLPFIGQRWMGLNPIDSCEVGGIVLDAPNADGLNPEFGIHGLMKIVLDNESIKESLISSKGEKLWVNNRIRRQSRLEI
jgi:predicted phosphodiesterase